MHTGDRHARPPAPTRWALRLRRHLGWVIATKLLLILLLFVLFFSPSQRPGIDPPGVADRLRLDR
jgi:hypothetical protein